MGGQSRRYEMTRSATDGHLQLIYRRGRFESLPFEIRLLAPWVGAEPFDIQALRADQRLQLAAQGYSVMRGFAGYADAA